MFKAFEREEENVFHSDCNKRSSRRYFLRIVPVLSKRKGIKRGNEQCL
jgi:hypothetical protein